jgi:hypothetical protein
MANTGEAARQLYQAIRGLNKLHADPLLRFKLLEVIRPYIYSIGTLLAKHFLQTSESLNQHYSLLIYTEIVLHSIDNICEMSKNHYFVV